MTLFRSILIFILAFCPLFSETIYVPVTGDYALIDSQIDLASILQDPNGSPSEKQELAEKIYTDQGSYNPFALLYAGLHFLSLKDFEKAAPLCVAGVLRSEIDARITKDETLADVSQVALFYIGEVIQEHLTALKEKNVWIAAFIDALYEFEQWDRTTPRNYDMNWVRLHSLHAFVESTFTPISEEEKQKIILRFYKELREEEKELRQGEEEHEDTYEEVSIEDGCYFDPEKRLFHHQDSELSFFVPSSIHPSTNEGKLDGFFEMSHEGFLSLDMGWSSISMSLEKDYEDALRRYEGDSHNVEKLYINKIPGLKERYLIPLQKVCVVNAFHIVKGCFSFDFELWCSPENEEAHLKQLQPLLDSVSFDRPHRPLGWYEWFISFFQ